MTDLDKSIKNEYAEFRNKSRHMPSSSNWKLAPNQQVVCGAHMYIGKEGLWLERYKGWEGYEGSKA